MLRRVRIDQEAYGLRRTVSPDEGILAVGPVARRHRPGRRRAAGAEPPSGLPVEPHPLDAFDGLGRLDALRRPQHALRRDEEEDARAAAAGGSEPL